MKKEQIIEVLKECIDHTAYGPGELTGLEEAAARLMEQQPEVSDSRNWEEDYSHENGNYQNRCKVCGNLFFGHKRRVVCKSCHHPQISGERIEELWYAFTGKTKEIGFLNLMTFREFKAAIEELNK